MTQDEAVTANAARFLQDTVVAYLAESPLNRLKDIDSSPIYDEPLVGFADGDNPLFQEYKTIIGQFHLTPREIMEGHLQELGAEMHPGKVSVISIILPLAKSVRLSNAIETQGPSLKWNHARWQGQACVDDVARYVVSALRDRGFHAVAPDLFAGFKTFDRPDGRCSNWSQRHAAYAAGLGTFSLSDGFITTRGIALRCTSVVTDLDLPATLRKYSSHLANCPFFVDGSCGACIQRCPAGAISALGHDKVKCQEHVSVVQKAWLEKPGYIGKYAGCGLCQTKVPCEARIPIRALKASSAR